MNPRLNLPRWSDITAVFGGRFDPPHLGHREAVRGLFQYPGIKQVLVVPSAAPPHKAATVSAHHRVEMARINFSHLPTDPFPQDVTLHLCELERAQRNPSVPSYAYDTLKELGSSLNDLAFVIGTDQLIQFHRWHRFVDLLSLSHWIVLDRKPSNEAAMKTLQEWKASGLIQPSLASNSWLIRNSLKSLTLVPTNAPSLSSTAIREEIVRTGNPPENSLLSGVLGYLKVHRLYGMKPTL